MMLNSFRSLSPPAQSFPVEWDGSLIPQSRAPLRAGFCGPLRAYAQRAGGIALRHWERAGRRRRQLLGHDDGHVYGKAGRTDAIESCHGKDV
jgi:hypothetical protein